MQKRIRTVAIFLLALTACGKSDLKRHDLSKPINNAGDSSSFDPPGTKADSKPTESAPTIISTQITPLVPSLQNDTLPDTTHKNSPPSSEITPITDTPSTTPVTPQILDPIANPTPVVATPVQPQNPVATQPETPVATPTQPTTPVVTYESALAEIEKYRSDIAPFRNDNAAASATGTVWLGDGVNVLNGERTPSCLALGTLSKQTTKIAQTQDNFEFVNNYYDFWKKMSTSSSIGGSGTFPWFTLGLSASLDTEHDVYITKDDIVAVASFNYKREEQTLYNARPAFAPYFSKVLGQNKGLFRMLCGDSFTKSVSLGGSMRIVFSAKKRDNKEYKKDAVKATLDLGFNKLFSLNSSFSFSKEQQEILKSYSFSMKCYTAGTKANICADFGLNTTFDFDVDGISLQQRMDDARKRMADDVTKGEDLVIVDEKFASYEAPISSCTLTGDEACPAPEKIYYDYRPRVDTAFKILSTLEKMDEICTATTYWKNRCANVRNQLTAALKSCAQSNTPCNEVQDHTQMDILLSAVNPGSFSTWTGVDRKSEIFSADFKGGDASGQFMSNTFYVFADLGWARANDKISSAEVHLAKGWKVRFWENIQTERRGNSMDFQNSDYTSNLGKMNDKFSAFELIPPPDLGE